MAYKFNPFTDTLDIVGSGGGSYIDGEVEYHADLPVTVGTPAVNSAFLVRKGQGLYFLTRKPAGIWVRELNNGNLDDWKYAGTFSDLYRDANFRIINDADTSKELAFSLSGLTTGTTRTLTVPNASGTIARTEDFASPPAIGNTTRNTGAFTTLSATGQASFSDQITGANATATPPTTITAAKGLQFALLGGSAGNTAAIYGSHGGTSTLGIGIANSSAGSITQVAAFTSTGLSVNGGTVTASAPVLDLAQTWNNPAPTYKTMVVNVTNAGGSNAANNYALEIQSAGTAVASIALDGRIRFGGILATGSGTSWATWVSGSYNNVMNVNAPLIVLGSGGTGAGAAGVRLQTEGVEHVLALRNAANPQTLRLYGQITGSDVSATGNYERGYMRWSAAGGVFQIGTEKGSGGGLARALEFQTDGTTRLTLATNGAATFAGNISAANNTTFFASAITWSNNFLTSSVALSSTLDCTSNPAGVRLFGLGGTAGNNNTNTERLHISTRTNASYFISTQATGTGTVRALELRTNDIARLTIEAAGGLTIADANDIAVGTTTGTKIGTATTQKIGFFNATPVVQQAAIADATDAATTQSRLNDLLAAMRSLGLIAT